MLSVISLRARNKFHTNMHFMQNYLGSNYNNIPSLIPRVGSGKGDVCVALSPYFVKVFWKLIRILFVSYLYVSFVSQPTSWT